MQNWRYTDLLGSLCDLVSGSGDRGTPVIHISGYFNAGASVYSASKLATEEYPDLDVTTRGAMSIGRRLQDPLAELVKIEPKHISVGQYQHDINQNLLKTSFGLISGLLLGGDALVEL